jgi:predicted permease
MRATGVYRALLLCYPAPFRREYGREMLGAFDAELRDARARADRAAVAGIWARALRDLVPTAFREHRHVLSQDLRHAVRVLAASPGFSAVAIASLALGLGANIAIFSLLNNVLFSTLPVRAPQELVIFTDPARGGVAAGMETGERTLLTYAEFRELQAAGLRSVSGLVATGSRLLKTPARIDGGEAEEIGVRLVSMAYFSMLGVDAAIGRTFDGAEPAPGSAPVAVLSHDTWQRRFGGRPDVVGRTIALRDGIVQVIGVAPDGFAGETVGERPDVWLPLAMQPVVLPGRDWLRDDPTNAEKVMWLRLFGRLRPGASAASAQAEANVVFRQGLVRYYGSAIADPGARQRATDQTLVVRPAATGASTLRDFADPLGIMLAGAALVLLIACANLGNLLLARATARAREVAVRLALGAGRGRLVRQLLTESLCLAAVGGVAGCGVALAVRGLLLRLAGPDIVLPAPFDLRVLACVAALTVAAGLMLGLLPALRVTSVPVVTGLREVGRGVAGSRAWLRVDRAVVVAQVALSLPLLVGAGLLVGTLRNLQRIDLGYDKANLFTIAVDAHPAGYAPARQAEALSALLPQIRGGPGVAAATYSSNGLFGGSDNGDEIRVEGYVRKGDNDRGSSYDAVAPGYFATLGVPVVAGREFTDADRAGGSMVCVINEAFARQFFAGRNPLGMHVTQVYGDSSHTYQIVGVVKDSRQNRLRGRIEHRFYTPATQPAAEMGGVGVIVRPRGDGGSVLAAVRKVIQQAEPRMQVGAAVVLADAVDRRLAQDRLVARLSLAFGVVAALLVAMGLYGVLSYGVARRAQELGVRKALGARAGALIGLVLRETTWLLVAGIVLGGALSWGAVQLIASRLYGLTAADPATLAIALVTLAAIGTLAAWLPAARAARVDPLIALRQE